MWRPEGWENPWDRDMPTFELDTDESIKEATKDWEAARKNFEAGADAMLETLRRNGVHSTTGMQFDGLFLSPMINSAKHYGKTYLTKPCVLIYHNTLRVK